ncbi:MAG: glycosyltransferase family 39 protein, partial [Candidatus Sumerlaeota bacterium]|nr:glycosyltransferase family 39 protein [Candidatus Sumerlaeota bacterium]
MSAADSNDNNPAISGINRFESFLQTRWGWRLAILLVLGLALFARTQNLHRQLWIDELITWDVIKLPFDQMIQNRLEEGHLPLFFILERYWTQATGDALWSMRLPSITADMIGVFLLILLGLEGYSRSVTLLGAALMAVHFQAVWAAQIMRPYAIVSALAIGSSIVFLRLEREGKWRYVIALAALTAIGIITHATFLFFVCCQVMYLVWNNWPIPRHSWRRPSALAREVKSALAQLLRRQWKPFAAYALAGLMMSYVWLGWNQKQHQVNPESDKGAVSVERMYRYLMDMAFGQYGKSDVVEDIGLKTRQFISWKKLGKLGQNIDKKLEKQPDDWFRILAAPALLIALGVTA